MSLKPTKQIRGNNLMLIALFFVLPLILNDVSNLTIFTNSTNKAIPCLPYIEFNSLPMYLRNRNISLNYTIFTPEQCYLITLNGTFSLRYKSNDTTAFTRTFSINFVTNTPLTNRLPNINTTSLKPDSYIAALNFSSGNYSNLSSTNFTLFNPANITITNFSVNPTQPSVGSQTVFLINLRNSGDLSSSNISISLNISGTKSYRISESASPLVPNQTELVTVALKNVTGIAGVYFATVNVSYLSNNTLVGSKAAPITYNVIALPLKSLATSLSPQLNTVIPLPYLSFSQLPIFSQVASGSLSIYHLGIQDTAGQPETVTLKVPSQFKNLLSLSATTLSLSGGQNLFVQVLFNAKNASSPGIYSIPINTSLKLSNGQSFAGTQHLVYSIQNETNGINILNQILTSTNNATFIRAAVSITVYSPENETLRNTTLTTILPASIISNTSQISMFLSLGSASIVNGSAHISWFIPVIPAGQSTTITYFISNPKNVSMLPLAQDLLCVSSAPKPSDLLKGITINLPTLYTNSTGHMTVMAFYTGAYEQNITISLFPRSNISILNPIRKVEVMPNQLIKSTFDISSSIVGTFFFSATITAASSSLSYRVPAIVLQGSKSTTLQSTTTIAAPVQKPSSFFPFNSLFSEIVSSAYKYGPGIIRTASITMLIISVLIAIAAGIGIYLKHKRNSLNRRYLISIKKKMT